MKKYLGHVLIGVLAIAIGFTIAVQAKNTSDGYAGGLISISQAQSLTSELNAVTAEKEDALEELRELEARISEIEAGEIDADARMKNMATELEKYKLIAGTTDVVGQGIIVTVDDPSVESQYYTSVSTIMYNYELLLSLVNKLKDAGAEAISINEQRITSTTEISLAGSNVNINTVPTAPPYTIKAIGNSDTLESTINIRFGIVDEMKNNYNLQVSVEKSEEITIPRYSGIIKFRYAETVVETDQTESNDE